jgi:L-ascorbate metabolism protein UlaG (beta-lactamase superfamily)
MNQRAKRILFRVTAIAVAILAAGLGWLWYRLNDHPSLEAYAEHVLRSTADAGSGPRVAVTFLGVATLLIDDGVTQLMTDGFFTRPGKLATLLGKIAPDRDLIAGALGRAGVQRLAAVIVVHSHYDHAMDAPEVARQTGAVVIGSESTANVARGWSLPAEQIRVVTPGEPMRFGAFTVTLLRSRHFPHGMAMGEITEPLVPPARAMDYKEGGSYSVLIEHPLGTLLVQGSAGWEDGALSGRRADVVLLGIGALGTKDAAYRESYWREVVDVVSPRCVIPIHYDDFTLPLSEPLRPMPTLADDVGASMRFLRQRVSEDPRIGLGLLPEWHAVPLLGAGAVACPDSRPRSRGYTRSAGQRT